METCSMEMNIHPVSKENLDAAKAHISKKKNEEGAFTKDGGYFLASTLMINADYEKGYYQWCAEVNGIKRFQT